MSEIQLDVPHDNRRFTLLLLACLNGAPTGIHSRARWSSRCGTRRGTHRDGSANHCGARNRVVVAVPPATTFHVDVLVDVDVVGAAAAHIGASGIRPAVAGLSATAATASASATGTSAATPAPAGRRPTAPPTTAAAATAAATAATATGGISVGGHGEAGQNERSHRG